MVSNYVIVYFVGSTHYHARAQAPFVHHTKAIGQNFSSCQCYLC